MLNEKAIDYGYIGRNGRRVEGWGEASWGKLLVTKVQERFDAIDVIFWSFEEQPLKKTTPKAYDQFSAWTHFGVLLLFHCSFTAILPKVGQSSTCFSRWKTFFFNSEVRLFFSGFYMQKKGNFSWVDEGRKE